jgi:hypothetical protein
MADQRVYARTFSQTLTLVAGLFCLEKRVSYRRLRKEFDLDDEILNDRRSDIPFPGSRLRLAARGSVLSTDRLRSPATKWWPRWTPSASTARYWPRLQRVSLRRASCTPMSLRLTPAGSAGQAGRSDRPRHQPCSGHDPFCNRTVAVKLSSS